MWRIKRDSFQVLKVLAFGVMILPIAGCARDPQPPPTPTLAAPVELTPVISTNAPQATPTAAPDSSPIPTPTPVTPVQSNALNLIQAFVDAPYRVVAVAKSPLAPYSLVVATERSAADCGSPEDPQRCTADDTCGSFYTSPTCYFFVEPSFDAAADPVTRYVSRWPDEPTASGLVVDSFRFIDARTVEFKAAGGDGAYAVEEVWWLDLVTGALAMQSRVEQGGGAP